MNKSEEFAMLVSKFLADYLPVQKNLSSNTILSYRNTFMLLLTFMQQIKAVPPEKMELSYLDSSCIQDFLLWLETERKCSISTRNQRLAAIHSFARYVMFVRPEMLYVCQQILGVSYKKVPQTIIHYLTESETRLLLAQPDTSTLKGIRDAAMLSLLCDSAARIQEFIDLSVGDLRINQPATLTITGKGRITRQVPIMKETLQLLEQYMSMSSLSGEQSSGHPLFVSHTGNRFTRPGVTHVMNKYRLQAFGSNGLSFPLTPHILRHSKGMHMLNAGINIYYIKEFLGHSDLSTTERYYVRADTEMKRKALSKMTDDITPKPSEEMPGWKKDSNILSWLKSLG
ncbi:site-specific integrase [Lederbergia sp. NSJ-179]|uniref:tyrosine-type recombinase/integrase n=1 Tax=Lederbergia sp. NSJ-179 TaxID=2931402 RepID=UPI001FD08FFF|nr:tyrosine-type recombinase/integrase [Lederbergia sp. NSJ-179]MCJ7842125.1 site-specific integrase [Lederbergia sp. NSJ-179]